MTIQALNRWRLAYLAEAVLYAFAAGQARTRGTSIGRGRQCRDAVPPMGGRAGRRHGHWSTAARGTLTLGASLWLMHDLAHGRWRTAAADTVALAGCAANHPWLIAAGVAFAALTPEKPPSPFIWNRSRVRPRANVVHLQR